MGIDAIRQVYMETSGAWTGCDWPTQLGQAGLELNGCTAAQAEQLARTAPPLEAADWRRAAEWLSQVELNAEQAQVQASIALASANAGDLEGALEHAERACVLEHETGRPTAAHWCNSWERFRQAIQETLDNRGQNSRPAQREQPLPEVARVLAQVKSLQAEVERLARRVELLERERLAVSANF